MGNKLIFGASEIIARTSTEDKTITLCKAAGVGLGAGEILAELQFKTSSSARTFAAMINLIADTLEDEEYDSWLSETTASLSNTNLEGDA